MAVQNRAKSLQECDAFKTGETLRNLRASLGARKVALNHEPHDARIGRAREGGMCSIIVYIHCTNIHSRTNVCVCVCVVYTQISREQ